MNMKKPKGNNMQSNIPSFPVDHASREWAINPHSDAWWRARGKAWREETGIKEPRTPIGSAFGRISVMFQRTYNGDLLADES